ncbi:hypothetical protein M8J76_006621 [Diaphorina citri]|nr:hypothetical protein M8J75_001093 [Diaphorina citri]KAI5708499.1 hypothetical protein M8J77_023926 [Diaphorina citri]KAI5708932.1 hypothetical protein M8J76_006621 [Diaphorina citri]
MLMVMIGLCASQDSQIACRDKQRLLGTDFEDKHELTEATLGSTHQLTCHYCNEADDLAPKLWYFEKRLIFDDVPQEVKLVLCPQDETSKTAPPRGDALRKAAPNIPS